MGGEEVAKRLKMVMVKSTDVSITGIDRVVIVRGTAAHHKEVARLIESFTASDELLAAFRLSRRRAIDLVPQLERLFQIEGKKAPSFLPIPSKMPFSSAAVSDKSTKSEKCSLTWGSFPREAEPILD